MMIMDSLMDGWMNYEKWATMTMV